MRQKQKSRLIATFLAIITVVLLFSLIKSCSSSFTPYGKTLVTYIRKPLKVKIHADERYEDYFLKLYPKLDNRDVNLGGAKVLGETFADAISTPIPSPNASSPAENETKWYSSRSSSSESWVCPPLPELGIVPDEDKDGISNRVIKGDIRITVSPVDVCGLWTSDTYFVVNITIENLRSRHVSVVIRQGLLLETIKDNVQNLVVRQTEEVYLYAHETRVVRVTAYCASHHRKDPKWSSVRITPFYLNADTSVFVSQKAVWSWQETKYVEYKTHSCKRRYFRLWD